MTRKKNRKGLTPEDRLLWQKVAQTTTPLSADRKSILMSEMMRLMDHSALVPDDPQKPEPVSKVSLPIQNSNAPLTTVASQLPSPSHPIEERVMRNLAKGRLSIDSRIDLHGMTQDRARFALLDFLQMSQTADHRIILVITGKGNEGTGVLRRNVPIWLSAPPFTALVNGFRESHISHGGEGALYVRVRKPAGRRRARVF